MDFLHRECLIPGVVVLFAALSVVLPARAAPAGPSPVLAVDDGKPITEADVHQANADEFKKLDREYQQNVRQLLESSLHQAVLNRMLDAEAAARNVSKDQLLAGIKPAAVTDADVDAFYEKNKAQILRPKDQAAPQIKQYLEQQGQTKAREDFVKTLEAKYKVEYKLELVRVAVAAHGPARGPANAPVTIVEFAGFQDPFSARLEPTLQEVVKMYGDKVRLVFRQFPLPTHPNARKTAEAALCAADQGRFWEMHDVLFASQKSAGGSQFAEQAVFGVDQLKAQAAKLGLNAAQFNAALDSGKHVADVEADFKAGEAAGVDGTPVLFINGRFINGVVPLEQITEVIDEELRLKEKQTPGH